MGSSASTSIAANPISDIKPTLNNSPAQTFNNQTKTLASGSRASESIYGDSSTHSVTSKTLYGDSLTNATLNKSTNQTFTVGSGATATITDGGAIGAMYQLTKQVLENQLKSVNDTVTEAKKDEKTPTTATELKDKFLEFYQGNKAAVILAAAAAGWFIYKGVRS